MNKFFAYFSDTWTSFFTEVNSPRSKATRIHWGILFWTPALIYIIGKLITSLILAIPFFAKHKFHVNATSTVQQMLDIQELKTEIIKEFAVTPILLQCLLIVGLVFAIFIIIGIWSYISRRFYDIGFSLLTSKTFGALITLIALYIALPYILVGLSIAVPPVSDLIPMIKPFIVSPMNKLIMSTHSLLLFTITVYIILQIVPSNMVLSKLKR